MTVLKVAGVDVTSAGRFEARRGLESEIVLEEPAEHRYRKLVLANGAVVGAILVGYPQAAAAVTAAVKERRAGEWEVLRARAG